MYAQVEKPKENKSQSVTKGLSQLQSGGESTFQIVDNRPEAVAQRKLQEMANNSHRDNRSQQKEQLIQKKSDNAPIQLKSEEAVRQEIQQGGILSNFSEGFISSHIGTGNNNNVKAAEVHAARAAPPLTNTVIMDARALKNALLGVAWVDSGDHWEVSTVATVGLQNTVKRNVAIAAKPAEAVTLGITGNGDHAHYFTVDQGAITAITGATDAEVDLAVVAHGAYPSGNSSSKKAQKRSYRQNLIDHINQQRREIANNAEVAWVKQEFTSIGGTNMNGNAAIASVADVNGVASRQKRVEVYIGKNSGEIYHFHREF